MVLNITPRNRKLLINKTQNLKNSSNIAKKFASLVYRNKNFGLTEDGKLIYPYKNKLVTGTIAKFLKNTFPDDKTVDVFYELWQHKNTDIKIIEGPEICEYYWNLSYGLSCMNEEYFDSSVFSLYTENPNAYKLAVKTTFPRARAVIYCPNDGKRYFSSLYGQGHSSLKRELLSKGYIELLSPHNTKEKQLYLLVKDSSIEKHGLYLDAFRYREPTEVIDINNNTYIKLYHYYFKGLYTI